MKKYKRFFGSLVSLCIILLPIVVLAANPLVPCTGLPDSPCDFNAFAGLVNNIIQWFLGISVSIAALVFAYAGGEILLHPEEPEKLQRAKGMLWNTLIGMVIILCAWIVVFTVIKALVPNDNPLRFLGGS